MIIEFVLDNYVWIALFLTTVLMAYVIRNDGKLTPGSAIACALLAWLFPVGIAAFFFIGLPHIVAKAVTAVFGDEK